MSYVQKLEDWYNKEKLAGRLIDIKFTLKTNEERELELGRKLTQEEKDAQLERTAKAVYKIVTNETKGVDFNHKVF